MPTGAFAGRRWWNPQPSLQSGANAFGQEAEEITRPGGVSEYAGQSQEKNSLPARPTTRCQHQRTGRLSQVCRPCSRQGWQRVLFLALAGVLDTPPGRVISSASCPKAFAPDWRLGWGFHHRRPAKAPVGIWSSRLTLGRVGRPLASRRVCPGNGRFGRHHLFARRRDSKPALQAFARGTAHVPGPAHADGSASAGSTLVRARGWPDVVIILDDSRSMSTIDEYQDPRVQEAAHRLAKETPLAAPDRLQLAKAFLTQNKMEWLENLLSRRRVKIHLYHCSSMAARVADASDVQQLQAVARRCRPCAPMARAAGWDRSPPGA